MALDMLADIDENTVDFYPDDPGDPCQRQLQAYFSNWSAVNGSQGHRAVGMATNIPPHNLAEVIDAVNHLMMHPEATPDDLMEFVKGPDFSTGALIVGRQGVIDAYRDRPRFNQAPRQGRARREHAPITSSSPSSPIRSAPTSSSSR